MRGRRRLRRQGGRHEAGGWSRSTLLGLLLLLAGGMMLLLLGVSVVRGVMQQESAVVPIARHEAGIRGAAPPQASTQAPSHTPAQTPVGVIAPSPVAPAPVAPSPVAPVAPVAPTPTTSTGTTVPLAANTAPTQQTQQPVATTPQDQQQAQPAAMRRQVRVATLGANQLQSEGCPATSDVRGNLGRPSVVTSPAVKDWLKDRWQAAVDMTGKPIRGMCVCMPPKTTSLSH